MNGYGDTHCAQDHGPGWDSTRAWVEKQLGAGERIDGVERLVGGWTSTMRRLRVTGATAGDGRTLVLRSFVRPFYLRHAAGLLTREADILRLLGPTAVPAAELWAVDALAFAPDAEKVAVPWRECGRTDLTAPLLTRRLEDYLEALLRRYG